MDCAIDTKLGTRILCSSRSACIDPEVKRSNINITVTKTITVARLLVTMASIPYAYTPLCYVQPLPAWVCMSIRLPMFFSLYSFLVAHYYYFWLMSKLPVFTILHWFPYLSFLYKHLLTVKMLFAQQMTSWKSKTNNSSTVEFELWSNAGPSAFQLQERLSWKVTEYDVHILWLTVLVYDVFQHPSYSGNWLNSQCVKYSPVFSWQTYKEEDEEAVKETSVWCLVTLQGRRWLWKLSAGDQNAQMFLQWDTQHPRQHVWNVCFTGSVSTLLIFVALLHF